MTRPMNTTEATGGSGQPSGIGTSGADEANVVVVAPDASPSGGAGTSLSVADATDAGAQPRATAISTAPSTGAASHLTCVTLVG